MIAQTLGWNIILSLCEEAKVMAVDAGQVLLSEGSLTGALYVLISGDIEILKEGFPIDTVSQPGSVFGEVSLLLGIPHTASVRAVSPSRLYKIESGMDFLNRHPQILLELARLLAHRLDRTTKYLTDLKRQTGGMTGILISMALEHQDYAESGD